uniref:Ig-like domain-containing protein n=1 Tax=Oncorhynchus kisutch TaxID=8019 RepID=A0A8C7MKV6_ONCKI
FHYCKTSCLMIVLVCACSGYLLHNTEVLTCECSSRSCQTVFWFRTLHNNLDIQFLLSLNNAGRTSHEPSVDEHRFKASKRDGGSKITFTLRLINISSEDAGLYTCMLQNQKENELWRPGVLLRPGGESNPFPCMHPKQHPKRPLHQKQLSVPKSAAGPGCGSKVLWPLVGVLLALAVALISTLYYFSRDYSAVLNSFFACATGLPKKCRHQYAK